MRLDEQPGEKQSRNATSAPTERGKKKVTQAERAGRNSHSSAGNSAMGDALSAAFGKKR